MPRLLKNKVRIDAQDFLAGFGKQYSLSSDIPREQVGFSAKFDPFRSYGFAQPGYSPDDVPKPLYK